MATLFTMVCARTFRFSPCCKYSSNVYKIIFKFPDFYYILSINLQEMQSILSLLNIPIKYIEKPSLDKPYWIVELPSEECAKKIASRSVLMKNCVELWSKAKSIDQLHKNLQNSLLNNTGKWTETKESHQNNAEFKDFQTCPKELIENCCTLKTTFKVEVETFCKHFSMKEKVEKIEVSNK